MQIQVGNSLSARHKLVRPKKEAKAGLRGRRTTLEVVEVHIRFIEDRPAD